MSQNRLNLDFTIKEKSGRVAYVNEYLSRISFTPNAEELEKIANYILWGTSTESGLNGRQEGLDLETRYKTWDSKKLESLDALLDVPGFNEASLRGPYDPPTKIPKQALNRSLIRKTASPEALALFEELWGEIDEVDYLIEQVEIKEGKRKEIRPPLRTRLDDETQTKLLRKAQTIGPYEFLKLKHRLVELRREQYLLKDSVAPPLFVQVTPQPIIDIDDNLFGEDVDIRPVGLCKSSALNKKIWNKERLPNPTDFSQEELKEISKVLWTQPVDENSSKLFFDFSDPNHLYVLYGMYEEVEDEAMRPTSRETTKQFLDTLHVYENLAELDETLSCILDAKIHKKTNQQICEEIYKKFGKKYQPNYISTLYCRKCLTSIAAAALEHREVLENIFFSENFKKCKDCGRILLLNERNFVRRARSNDGFSPRCKKCEKIKRDRGKVNG